jgi:hypothetical protein
VPYKPCWLCCTGFLKLLGIIKGDLTVNL